jgi:hypothetical protein
MPRKPPKVKPGPKGAEKAPVQTPPPPEIVEQGASSEAAASVSSNDVVVNAETIFGASPVGSAPRPPVIPIHIRAQTEFVNLRTTDLDNGLTERLDVWDIVGNGALLRFTYFKGDDIQGVPQVVFVDNIRPDFEKGKIIRSLR